MAKAKARVNRLLQSVQQLPQKSSRSFLDDLDDRTREDVMEVARALARRELEGSLSDTARVFQAAGLKVSKGQLQYLVSRLRLEASP